MTKDSVKDPDGNPAIGPVRDPVSGFEIPGEWIERSGDPCALDKIRSGKWVLLSDGRMLLRGYTTGTTSAAACKGAVLSLALAPVERLEIVDVMTPAGIRVSLTVEARAGICRAVKDGGDHQFDITNGIEVLAKARESERIELIAGEGIGSITAGGLCAPQGKPAISRSARQQIMKAIEEGLEMTGLEGCSGRANCAAWERDRDSHLEPKGRRSWRDLHPGLDGICGALERSSRHEQK